MCKYKKKLKVQSSIMAKDCRYLNLTYTPLFTGWNSVLLGQSHFVSFPLPEPAYVKTPHGEPWGEIHWISQKLLDYKLYL